MAVQFVQGLAAPVGALLRRDPGRERPYALLESHLRPVAEERLAARDVGVAGPYVAFSEAAQDLGLHVPDLAPKEGEERAARLESSPKMPFGRKIVTSTKSAPSANSQ